MAWATHHRNHLLERAGCTAIDRAMSWFAAAFSPDHNPGGGSRWKHYYLYGVERIGRASGRKYFRDRDWFKEGAAYLLASQEEEGHWEDGGYGRLEDTCFALMFLSHGRAPLLFSKLQHGEDWNNKLRDVAGLTRFAEKRFEKLLNWQIVSLDGPIADLLEAPILYMSGHEAWHFTDDETAKLREYCNRGGMILGVSCCSSKPFSDWFKQLAATLFPSFPMKPLPADRDLHRLSEPLGIDDSRGEFTAVTRSRVLRRHRPARRQRSARSQQQGQAGDLAPCTVGPWYSVYTETTRKH